jgi:hypothetical protein
MRNSGANFGPKGVILAKSGTLLVCRRLKPFCVWAEAEHYEIHRFNTFFGHRGISDDRLSTI